MTRRNTRQCVQPVDNAFVKAGQLVSFVSCKLFGGIDEQHIAAVKAKILIFQIRSVRRNSPAPTSRISDKATWPDTRSWAAVDWIAPPYQKLIVRRKSGRLRRVRKLATQVRFQTLLRSARTRQT